MIFLTVGTYPLSFERLVEATDTMITKGFIEEGVFAQVGVCNYKPKNMEYVEMLQKEVYDYYFEKASAVISHAGIGTIMMALDNEKPLLVMPRLQKYGEVVNEHQIATAKRFEELGHVLVAYTEEGLPDKLRELKTFVPKPRENQAKAVADRISKFLNEIRISKEQL